MLDAGPDHVVFIMLNPGLDHCKGKLTGMLSTNSMPRDCEWDLLFMGETCQDYSRIQDFDADFP